MLARGASGQARKLGPKDPVGYNFIIPGELESEKPLE